MSPVLADSVAKVFLRHGSQILRGVGAAIEQRCGGPRRHTQNSQAIPAAGLRLYRAAIVACFVLWREFSKTVPGVSSVRFWSKLARREDIAGPASFAIVRSSTCLVAWSRSPKRSTW